MVLKLNWSRKKLYSISSNFNTLYIFLVEFVLIVMVLKLNCIRHIVLFHTK